MCLRRHEWASAWRAAEQIVECRPKDSGPAQTRPPIWLGVFLVARCGGISRSLAAIASAETRNVRWMTTWAMSASRCRRRRLMNVFSRWIEEMPMIAVASLTFSTQALTCDSHSGWSGWPSRFIRETNVS